MPGDSRAQVGFIGFNSALHFIQFGSEENSRAHVHVVTDIDGEKKAENLHEAAIVCVIFSLIVLNFPFPVRRISSRSGRIADKFTVAERVY